MADGYELAPCDVWYQNIIIPISGTAGQFLTVALDNPPQVPYGASFLSAVITEGDTVDIRNGVFLVGLNRNINQMLLYFFYGTTGNITIRFYFVKSSKMMPIT